MFALNCGLRTVMRGPPFPFVFRVYKRLTRWKGLGSECHLFDGGMMIGKRILDVKIGRNLRLIIPCHPWGFFKVEITPSPHKGGGGLHLSIPDGHLERNPSDGQEGSTGM